MQYMITVKCITKYKIKIPHYSYMLYIMSQHTSSLFNS